jgi:dihydroorotate dehydrogenase (fumarate)
MALRLPLRWIAILYDRVAASLAATSGVHSGADAMKLLLAGADVTMLCSVLLRHGIKQLRIIEQELCNWMQEHEYNSIKDLKGTLSHKNCEDPSAFERAQYMRALRTFKPA